MSTPHEPDQVEHPPADAATVAAARRVLAGAEAITVLTGAGISTDSGIPDFRGPNGLWTKDPDAEKAADIRYYVADPEVRRRAWQGRLRWHAEQRLPNPGHHALVDLERQGRLHTLVTQNIDGLHQAAGSSPDLVVEVHGTVREVVCLACDERAPIERALERVRAGEEDPDCRSCGGMLKSATISFGQSLVAEDLERAMAAAEAAEAFLAVGTSLSVYPVAYAVDRALHAGVPVVIVNAEPTGYDDHAAAVVRGSISEVLGEIVQG